MSAASLDAQGSAERCRLRGACWHSCCRSCSVSWQKNACSWGLQRGKAKPPLGVVLVTSAAPSRAGQAEPGPAHEPKPIDATAKLSAVNESARRYGVREGQSIAEACALVSSLVGA